MPTKAFEHAIPFRSFTANNAGRVWLPVVEVAIGPVGGPSVRVPLLFDTGATFTMVCRDLYPILGVTAWDVGTPVRVDTAGGPVINYQYSANVELLGKVLVAPVVLSPHLAANGLFVGLFGRMGFEHFGFGFWESARQLYVTLTP